MKVLPGNRLLVNFIVTALILRSYCASSQQSVIVELNYLKPSEYRVGYVQANRDTIFNQNRSIRVKGKTPVNFRLLNCNREALKIDVKTIKGPNIDSISGSNFKHFVKIFGDNLVSGVNLSDFVSGRGGTLSQSLSDLRPDLSQLAMLKYERNIEVIDEIFRNRISLLRKWETVSRGITLLRENTTYTKTETKSRIDNLLKSLSPEIVELFRDDEDPLPYLHEIIEENLFFLKELLLLYAEKVADLPDSDSRSGGNDSAIGRVAKGNLRKYQNFVDDDFSSKIQDYAGKMVESYASVQENSFESEIYTTLEEGIEKVFLNVYRKPGIVTRMNDENAQPELVHSESFEIKSRGNIKILSSFGIGITSFINSPQDYFVKDGILVSSKSENVIPRLSAYLNFTGTGNAPFKIGGHLGVGFRLFDNLDQSMVLKLGPSFLLGTKSLIAINFGIHTGKTSRLTKGWKAGEAFDGAGDIPVSGKYELGYHFGVSFNLQELLK